MTNHPIRPRQHIGGIVTPICLAAFKLIINSNFVDPFTRSTQLKM